MALKRSLMFANGVENMNLCVIQRNYNVSLRQMEARDNTLVWRDMFDNTITSLPPCSLNHILLLEMRSVAASLRSSLDAWAA